MGSSFCRAQNLTGGDNDAAKKAALRTRRVTHTLAPGGCRYVAVGRDACPRSECGVSEGVLRLRRHREPQPERRRRALRVHEDAERRVSADRVLERVRAVDLDEHYGYKG